MGLRQKYVPHIDGLRAVAVLAVVAYHLNAAFLPGGFTGVDVFFVISGFVVSGSVAELEGIGFRAFLAYFYARRLLRIGPALIVCLLLTSLFFALWIPTALYTDIIRRAASSAFAGLSNFSLARTEHDYFAPGSGFNPFTHTWSLGVEEQFYLIFPWIFVPWLHLHKRLSAALAGAGFMASLAVAYWLGQSNAALAFYMITTRFWELAAGLLLFQLSHRWQAAPRVSSGWGAEAVAGLSLLALLAGLLTASPDSTPFPGGILPCLGTVGLLASLPLCCSGFGILRALEHKTLRFFGKISYSLYLWHWPVFVAFRWTVGLRNTLEDVAAVGLALLLAVFSFRFVETPPRRWLAATRISKAKVAIGGLLALAIGYGITQGIWALQPVMSFSNFEKHQADWLPYGSDTDPAHPGCRIVSARHLIPGGAYWEYSRAGCDEPVHFAHRIFAIGDSHSAAYEAMLKQVTMHTGAVTYLYWRGGCGLFGLRGPDAPDCASFNQGAETDVLSKLKADDVVFLSSKRTPRGSSDPGAPGAAQVIADRAAGAKAALLVLQQISGRGAFIIFEAPTPFFPSQAYRCVDWYDSMNPDCHGESISRVSFEHERGPVMPVLMQFTSEVKNLFVWDPAPLLCDAQSCLQVRDGHPLFFDTDHVTSYADGILEPGFEALISQIENNRAVAN